MQATLLDAFPHNIILSFIIFIFDIYYIVKVMLTNPFD